LRDYLIRFLSHGAFADVFDLDDGTVAKVFRRTSHTNNDVRSWDDHEFITRRLFATEVAAYERLQDKPDLVRFIPRYYGTIDQASLTLPASSTGEPYVAGCVLRLELIAGRDIKAGLVAQPLQKEIDDVLWQILDVAGRVHVWDCSCFIPGPRTPFVIIDFAMWEDLPDVQSYLDEHGHIPDDMRRRLSIV
jgi:hypothetical protein